MLPEGLIDFMLRAKRNGHLKPEYQAMTDEEYLMDLERRLAPKLNEHGESLETTGESSSQRK